MKELRFSIVSEAYAEDQRSKNNIRRIIERCKVRGGYVEDGYVYGLKIKC